jgi:CubicO group peptidase (beta-lactamase class C family)
MKFLLLISIALILNSCHVGRYFYWNFADIHDHEKFEFRPIQNAEKPFIFPKQEVQKAFIIQKMHFRGKEMDFETFLEKSRSVGFAVIRHDTVIYEHFTKNYNRESVVPSFSMAKSFVSTLVGIALEEGKIKSLDEPITHYLKDLDTAKFGKITIEHLLNMRSGIKFNESYFNPFGDVAKAYYGTDLRKLCRNLKIKKAPDTEFDYISINTQLLGFIVEEATGKKLDQYLQEKIWQPLQMEHPATWSIDSKKHQNIKAFCSLNATLYDFAKIGRLFLNKGNWNGKQIVSKNWVQRALTNGAEKNNRLYSYQWWIYDNIEKFDGKSILKPNQRILKVENSKDEYLQTLNFGYAAHGILDQFVYFCPCKDLIIVRLGSYTPSIHWPTLFNRIASKI